MPFPGKVFLEKTLHFLRLRGIPQTDGVAVNIHLLMALANLLGNLLTIFRLAAVWSVDCPRVRQLELHIRDGEPHQTYPNYMINVTFAEQIGTFAKYVIDHNLHGIFHVGTTDTVNYHSFEQKVCEALKIKSPQFAAEATDEEKCFAILPTRKEIPNDLQMTVSDVLSALK